MRLQEKVQLRWLAVCATIGSLSPYASAVITIGGTGNNYTLPPDGVGNYEGDLGSFTGTTISSNCIGLGDPYWERHDQHLHFRRRRLHRSMAASLDDLGLGNCTQRHRLVFDVFALYTGSSEVNSPLIVVGRARARAAITGGWDLSTMAAVRSPGERTPSRPSTPMGNSASRRLRW